MNRFKTFWAVAFASALITAIIILTSLDFIGLVVIWALPLFVMTLAISDDDKKGERFSVWLALFLIYSVVFGPWGPLSVLILLAIIIVPFILDNPSPTLYVMAACLLGMEAASVFMEYRVDKTYHMDNLWHDVATVVFVVYVVAIDIYLAKNKKVESKTKREAH